ncbi:hypothetical protein N7G274_003939 [Stereocaulon virgatum]|uniref:Nitrogen permease regulator 3 n=1 Tax=Stereocaulon virgatum TaxID=373712 RepID=A0ABR4ACT4_9LECA
MASQPLPPNPCLVAILLVVKTTDEPFIAFHYPPRPGEDNSLFKGIFRNNGEESTSSSDDESQDSAAEAPEPNRAEVVQKGDSPPDVDDNGYASPEKNNGFVQNGSQQLWNDLFGSHAGLLARFLCPAVSCHKKRFEVGLHDSVFIGWPVFSRPGGTWRKARKPRRSSSRSKTTAEKTKRRPKELGENRLQSISGTDDSDASRSAFPVESQSEGDQDMGLQDEQDTLSSVSRTKLKGVNKPSDATTVTPKEERPLVMFNVVCVLRPPPLEYHIRVKEMYDNVVKKLGKALRWEQMHSNFVARETALIASLTEPMNNLGGPKPPLSILYHDLITQSNLAKGISTLYNSIASSRIAHVSLTPFSSLSLQIPIASSISVLPTPLEAQLPGLWLTTANSMPTDDDAHTSQLGSHFTLLLLSDMHSILSDITAAASPIAKPLTHYLRVTSPWKSFSQISQSSGIPLSDIQFLASHLIYWRRARAIPPLHQRDTYIVSPNADMRKLASATSAFAKAFPALPPLPKILSLLSSAPRPYANLMPSKDHKPAYMDILAWLMRENWVTQLRTFAWVRVPSHIRETVSKHPAPSSSDKSPKHTATDDSDDASTSSLGVPDSISSSRLSVPLSNPASPTSSTHTTLPFIQKTPHSPCLIHNPRLASALPSRYLSAISTHVLEIQGEESQSAWDKCVRYFDGKHAIETIPVREGWKRKKVVALLTGWEELGVLVRGRHW